MEQLHTILYLKGFVSCSRRSRIFLRRGPLSCEVPGRRDSVGGGGVVAGIFCRLQTASRLFSGGGSTIHFSLMGPFYIFLVLKRGAPFCSFGIFNRGDPLFHFWDFQKGGGPGPPLNRPLSCTLGSIHLLSTVWGYSHYRASDVQILRESGFISHAYHIVRVTRF